MGALYHVHLTVHSRQGVFEGRLTGEPVRKEEAQSIQDEVAHKILKVVSLAMIAHGKGPADIFVLPADILQKSVLLFQQVEALNFGHVVLEP